MRKIKKMLKDLFKSKIIAIGIIIISIITASLLTLTPKITGEIMTEIYNQLINKLSINGFMVFDRINRLLIYLLIIYIGYAILNYIKSTVIVDLCQKYIKEVRQKFNEKIFKLPIKYFDNKNIGEFLSILTNDIENLNNNLSKIIRDIITESLNIICVCIMMLYISPQLLIINIIIIIISGIIISKFSSISKKYFVRKQEDLGDMNDNAEEIYSSHTMIKLFGLEEYAKKRFDIKNEKLRRIWIKSEFLSSIAGNILDFFENLATIIIIIISTILNIQGIIEIGYIYTVINYTRKLANPLKKIGSMVNEIMNVTASLDRVNNFLEEEEIDVDKENVEQLKKDIQINSIRFEYEKNISILRNVNMLINKGEKIAIIGRTGSGKTTLAKLLLKIYETTGGTIEYDNIDINKFNEEQYLNQYGIITQDMGLFTDTLMENIKYGNENISEKEIIEMAKKIGVNEVFESLENGYNTLIGEKDSNISDGIKQLIILMQNMISESSILVFDEATNKLDEEMQEKIQNVIRYMNNKKTLIFITHKLELLEDVDKIYLLKDGIIELVKNKT